MPLEPRQALELLTLGLTALSHTYTGKHLIKSLATGSWGDHHCGTSLGEYAIPTLLPWELGAGFARVRIST